MRLNSNGDTLWTRHLIDRGVRILYEVTIAANGDFVFVGGGIQFHPVDLSPVVGRFDSSGNEVWIRQYTELEFRWILSGYSICNAHDSGFVVGAHNDATPAEPSLQVFKINDNGEPEWITPFGGPGFQSVEAVIRAEEGYAAVGFNDVVGGQGFSIRLMRISLNGDSLWSNTYAESYECYGNSLIQTTDSGFLIAGTVISDSTNQIDADIVIIRTDYAGNQVWDHRFGGALWDDATDIVMNTSGDFTICGSTRSFAETYDAYLMSIDINGDSLWFGSYGGASSDVGSALTPTSDGGYALCGTRQVPPDFPYWDDWVLRLSE
ncbi:hypothetical protein KKC97_13020, partial [bacterium]|nr:hypothetical protein [bacterium]